MSFMNDLFSKLSRGTSDSLEKEFDLIGNAFGFYGIKPGIGTSTFVNELANIASSEGLHTCVIDCSPLSTFWATKYIDCIDPNKEMPSIGNRFAKHSCELTDCLINVNPKLKLLTFGEMALSSSFDMDKKILKDTFEEVKSVFDLVLLDIQNLPWLETTLEALLCCSTIYTMLGYDVDSCYTFEKTRVLLKYAGLNNKVNNIIVLGNPNSTNISPSIMKHAKNTMVLAELPEVPGLKRTALNYTSVLNELSGSAIKNYTRGLNMVFSEITNGISDKQVEV